MPKHNGVLQAMGFANEIENAAGLVLVVVVGLHKSPSQVVGQSTVHCLTLSANGKQFESSGFGSESFFCPELGKKNPIGRAANGADGDVMLSIGLVEPIDFLQCLSGSLEGKGTSRCVPVTHYSVLLVEERPAPIGAVAAFLDFY